MKELLETIDQRVDKALENGASDTLKIMFYVQLTELFAQGKFKMSEIKPVIAKLGGIQQTFEAELDAMNAPV